MNDARLIDLELLRTMPLPVLPAESDKDARGQVMVVAGGARVPGAPLLTGLAALRAGAGKLQMAASDTAALVLGMAAPEAAIVTVPGDADGEIGLAAADHLSKVASHADAVIIGPGMMGDEVASLAMVVARATPATPFVFDAGALKGLMSSAVELGSRERLVITPHAGEMARLLDWSREAVLADPASAARHAAIGLNAVVALKGETTWVAHPDGGLWRHEDGVIGLGTSGSGDVLAGVIGGLMARGASPLEATVRGVFIHGLAGRRLTKRIGPMGFLAREIVDEVPAALAVSAS